MMQTSPLQHATRDSQGEIHTPSVSLDTDCFSSPPITPPKELGEPVLASELDQTIRQGLDRPARLEADLQIGRRGLLSAAIKVAVDEYRSYSLGWRLTEAALPIVLGISAMAVVSGFQLNRLGLALGGCVVCSISVCTALALYLEGVPSAKLLALPLDLYRRYRAWQGGETSISGSLVHLAPQLESLERTKAPEAAKELLDSYFRLTKHMHSISAEERSDLTAAIAQVLLCVPSTERIKRISAFRYLNRCPETRGSLSIAEMFIDSVQRNQQGKPPDPSSAGDLLSSTYPALAFIHRGSPQALRVAERLFNLKDGLAPEVQDAILDNCLELSNPSQGIYQNALEAKRDICAGAGLPLAARHLDD